MAQDGAPSERACDRCRERRVKCDKRQPSCLRCEKLGKPCPGYDKKRKFVDEGIGLRKKFSAASAHHDSPQHSSNRSESSVTAHASPLHSNTITPQAQSTYSHDSPDQRSHSRIPSFPDSLLSGFAGSNISSTTSDPPPLPPNTVNPIYRLDTDQLLEKTNAEDFSWDIFSDPSLDPAWFDLDAAEFYAGNELSCGFIPSQPNIVDEVDREDVMQSTETDTTSPGSGSGFGFYANDILWAPESQLNTSALITDEREHEMAYLIRHFTEAIGPWMDLFDQDKHFGDLVPLKALRDALLRNAIAAVSAKQLGRVKGTRPHLGVQSQKPATMEVIEEVDWFYKAANYYDKAIAFSRVYLQAISGSLSNPPTPGMQVSLSMANSDDLLVAVSIFSLYESLDNLEVGWLQHLSGLKTLLSAVSAEEQVQTKMGPAITVGRRASFWNFARADYQASYINGQHTFLDTDDLALWRSCGLQIQRNGALYHNPAEVKNDPVHCRQVAELVAHTLLWLVLRVTNLIAGDRDSITSERQTRWLELSSQLDEWHLNLPETFQPCAQMRSRGRLTEVFFSMNVCAAAMQLYHFARILLLLNNPQETSGPGSGIKTLHSSPELSGEASKHAREIVGIALGRPHPAVRVEMLLPLHIAGVCLDAEEERQVVLELLRAIENDTGCSTEARCLDLMERWSLSEKSVADVRMY